MKVERGVTIESSLGDLDKFFREWIKTIETYCDCTIWEEAPYWYTERALVSTMVGTAWRNKCLALAEFQAEKNYKGETFIGFVDLWLQWGAVEYVIEAKMIYVSLQSSADEQLKKIRRCLSQVKGEAKNDKVKGCKKLGILFVVPYLSSNKGGTIDNSLRDFLESLKDIGCDATAWSFPESVRLLKHEGFLYPGVVMLAVAPQDRHRGNRKKERQSNSRRPKRQ